MARVSQPTLVKPRAKRRWPVSDYVPSIFDFHLPEHFLRQTDSFRDLHPKPAIHGAGWAVAAADGGQFRQPRTAREVSGKQSRGKIAIYATNYGSGFREGGDDGAQKSVDRLR